MLWLLTYKPSTLENGSLYVIPAFPNAVFWLLTFKPPTVKTGSLYNASVLLSNTVRAFAFVPPTLKRMAAIYGVAHRRGLVCIPVTVVHIRQTLP